MKTDRVFFVGNTTIRNDLGSAALRGNCRSRYRNFTPQWEQWSGLYLKPKNFIHLGHLQFIKEKFNVNAIITRATKPK